MRYLAAHNYYTPPLHNLLNGEYAKEGSGRTPVVLTFDDGYLDNFQNAVPIMKEFGFTGITFLVTDFSRRTNWWDKPKGIPETQLLELQHIMAMDSEGMQFGSHTSSHRTLTELNEEELREELRRSKDELEEVLHRPVTFLAYPYGEVNEQVKIAVRSSGYTCAFATNSGPLLFHSDRYQIRRVNVGNAALDSYMFYKLSGLEKLIRWGKWKMKSLVRGSISS